jgi:hypothetical protein
VTLDWDQWFDSDLNDTLTLLEASLAKHWQGYPHDLKSFESALSIVWQEIALMEGFRFVEGTEGDGVYFDTR